MQNTLNLLLASWAKDSTLIDVYGYRLALLGEIFHEDNLEEV